jgi:FMN phosphatase YigB (HAD superfamily)
MERQMAVRMVVFDVGETLVDETRMWGEWADWLGTSRLTFFATLGAVIATGRHHREVFTLLRPDIDLESERREREAQGWRDRIQPGDFYADALPCIGALRSRGYRIGIAGNQRLEIEDDFRRIGVSADFIGSPGRWSVAKPSLQFFAEIIKAAGLAPHEVAYVGDRLDYDVLPAIQMGMVAVFLRRGPWGVIHAERPEVSHARLRVESLGELPDALEQI